MQKSEPAAEGESTKRCVEVSKDFLRQGGRGVAIQGQQGEGGDPSEGTAWQGPQQIEPKVQNLQHFGDISKLVTDLVGTALKVVKSKISRDNTMLRCVA